MRFEVAKKIVQRAADFGIPAQDIVVDPLVMPVGAINEAGRSSFHLLRRLREELKVNTTCGASNFSFGLPNRHGLNAAFLPMMIGAGMTSAIMNPLHAEEMQAMLGADVVKGTIRIAPLDPPVPRPRRSAPMARLAAAGARPVEGPVSEVGALSIRHRIEMPDRRRAVRPIPPREGGACDPHHIPGSRRQPARP